MASPTLNPEMRDQAKTDNVDEVGNIAVSDDRPVIVFLCLQSHSQPFIMAIFLQQDAVVGVTKFYSEI